MVKRPFRFGVASYGASSGKAWISKAKNVEQLGFSTLLVPDHFIEQIATIPALTSAAVITKNLRVGSIVLCNDFRHPILLAKEAATIDFLSDGRFELGIGAGWMKAEYDAIGINYDKPGERVSRLIEAVKIIKGYWGETPFSFKGKHYTVDESKGIEKIPRPIQKPHPPILIGGGGKRTLSFAAKEADIVGIALRVRPDGKGPDIQDGNLSLDQKIQWIRSAAGERFDSLELNILTWVLEITNDPKETIEKMAKKFPLSPETLQSLPYILIGSIDEICDKLYEYRDRYQISYFVIWDRDMEAFSPIAQRMTGK
jgi:probable F420-dependent oxidoreductase